MKDFPFILVTASLVIRFLAQVSADCKVKSGTGLALNGYAYFTFSAKDFIQCFDRCKAGEPICQSLNYYSDTKSCDLNNGTRTVHASDMIENPMAIYFESHNRVSRGSQATVAASSCKAIHFKENSAKDGLYWLNSNGTEPPFLTFCKMKNGGDTSDSFDLIFQDRNTNNFVVIDTSFPDLSAFTVCFWFKSFERQLVFLSYATHSFTDAIMMFLSSGGLFRFLVLDRQTHGQTGTFHDKAWHHVCGTWADNDGIVRLFIDGTCKFSGNVAIHGMISGTGKLVLGQDQDTLGGGFDYHQSFVGELSHLYLWNTDLGSSVISHLSIVCKEDPHPHYIVEWSQFMKGINGNVTRRDQSRCVTKRRLLH